jgi:tetratricopeptide (TPR) repeat protein
MATIRPSKRLLRPAENLFFAITVVMTLVVGGAGQTGPPVGARTGGATVSVTSLAAPKQAQAAYEKGRNAMRKRRWDEAAKQLEKAVQIYPKYAAAWSSLGRVRERQGNVEAAAKAYRDAIRLEPKFVRPYIRLAAILVQAENWTDAADVSAQALRLAPNSSPLLWVDSALANVHLGKTDEAEAAAIQAIKIDTRQEYPEAEYILAVMLANKGNFPTAVEHMRTYLKLAPKAANAAKATEQLAGFERAANTPGSPASK